MQQQRPTNPPDLTDGWPDDPANADLARLASDLFASRPHLPQLALDRIQVRMRQEAVRVARRRRVATVAAILIAAAALAIGLPYAFRTHPTPPAPAEPTASVPDVPIQDQFKVTLPTANPKAPHRPLIDLENAGPLFGDPAPRR
ncbi:MAG TPA: hypothetical protein VEA69_18745 [Tepidisphaeraceae bacterium]|nr:hypothetical protein [Tepidisphaeraceae bacterium]